MSRPIFYLPTEHYQVATGLLKQPSKSIDPNIDPKELVDRVFQSLRGRFYGAHFIEELLDSSAARSHPKKPLHLLPEIQKVGLSKKELLKLGAIIARDPIHCHMSIPEALVKTTYEHLKAAYPIKALQHAHNPANILLDCYAKTLLYAMISYQYSQESVVEAIIPQALALKGLHQHLQTLYTSVEKKPGIDKECLDAIAILLKITSSTGFNFRRMLEFPCTNFAECPHTGNILSLKRYSSFCRQLLQASADPSSQALKHIRSLEQLLSEAEKISSSAKKFAELSELTHKIFQQTVVFNSSYQVTEKRMATKLTSVKADSAAYDFQQVQKLTTDFSELAQVMSGFYECFIAIESNTDINLASLVTRIRFLVNFLYKIDNNIALPPLTSSLSHLSPLIQKCLDATALCMDKTQLDEWLFSEHTIRNESSERQHYESTQELFQTFLQSTDPIFLAHLAEETNLLYASIKKEADPCGDSFDAKKDLSYIYTTYSLIKEKLRPYLNLEHVSTLLKTVKKDLDDAIDAKGHLAADELQSIREALCAALTPCMISCILFADVKAAVENQCTLIEEIFPQELLELAFYSIKDTEEDDSLEEESTPSSTQEIALAPSTLKLKEQDPSTPVPALEEASKPAEAVEVRKKENKKRDKASDKPTAQARSISSQTATTASKETPSFIKEDIIKARKIRKIRTLLNRLSRAGYLDFSKGSRQRGSHIQLPGGITIANHGGRQSIPLKTLQSIGNQVENAAC